MMIIDDKVKGLVFAILGALSWGISGVVGESLFRSGANADAVSVCRMIFAGIVFVGLSFLFPRKGVNYVPVHELFVNFRSVFELILFSLLGMMVCQYGYLLSISYSDAGTATMICYIGPVLVMIASCILNQKMPKRGEVLALMMAVIGVFLLATKGDFRALNLNINALIWGIASAIGMIFYTLTPARIIKKHGSMLVMGVALIIAGVVLGVNVRVWEVEFIWNVDILSQMMVIVLVGTVGAFWLFINGVILIGAIKASMIACLEPLCAALLSFVFFGTHFLWIDLVAFACVISTVFLMNKE